MSEGKGHGFASGFLFGGIIGAALALLMAPRPGEETREMLLERSGEFRGVAEDLLQTGKTVVDEQRTRVEQAIRAGREAADEVTTEMLSDLDKAQRPGAAS